MLQIKTVLLIILLVVFGLPIGPEIWREKRINIITWRVP